MGQALFSNHVIEFIVCGKTEYIIRKVKCGRQASGALLSEPHAGVRSMALVKVGHSNLKTQARISIRIVKKTKHQV